uniref:Uncharacterized protein n=1 Tax=Oryza glumipatula TaxID=40148 RepID=A0A0D9YN45_9ORYZ
MAKKKDSDDVAAVYTAVMDHVVGEVHGDGVELAGVLAAVRARWEAKLARRRGGAALDGDGDGDGAPPEYKPAAGGGYCCDAPSSGPHHHDAVVKEEEEVAAAVDDDGAFFPAAAAAPETSNDGAASRAVVRRDLLGTLGAKRKRDTCN